MSQSDTVTVDSSVFAVKTDAFEGPMELLLELVEKRKLLINDISLAEVTDEYMATVSDMQERSLPNTAAFVQLAATLLLIKSKSLLPVLQLTEDEESAIEDLEERLKLYQIYKQAAESVQSVFGTQILHERQYVTSTEPLFVTDKWTEPEPLHEAMWHVLSNLPVQQQKPKVQVRSVISLEQMMGRLAERIERARQTSLRELVAGENEPKTIIVGFLAILESVKQGSVLVAQLQRYDDITVERHDLSAPKYY
ncbi:MAG TPA: ScpA family protein [Candidatus Paceibacterota bacterium]|nr:ScpA family protein [Candidatus Paceibacterota bacterium]